MAFHRGSEGRKRTDNELARQKEKAEQRKKQGSQPFRFYVPVGETRQVIIADDAPDFFMYEHNLPGPDKKWRTYTGCIKEDANCPVCESAERESYYAMFLTVIDLTPFATRDGKEVEFSRKLMCVKPGQQKKFLRLYEKEGSLRGALLSMTRDGDKDASIGNDIEFEEFVDEAELESYVRSWKDKEGKKHTEVCHAPFVYEDLFEEATEESLRAMVGGRPSPGSKEHDDRALGRSSRTARGATRGKADDDWEEADDQREYAEKKPPARGRATPAAEDKPAARPRRGRTEEVDEEAAEVETKPTRRGRTAEPEEKPARTRNSERVTRRAAEPVEDDVEDDDPPFDPDPPRKGRAAPPARTAEAKPAARRGRAESVEDEAEEDEAPARGAPRRAVMRGRR